MKTLITLITLAAVAYMPNASAAKALEGQERGAGSMVKAEIEKTMEQAVTALEQQAKARNDVPAAELRAALTRAKITVVDKLEALDGSDLDAINDPATGEIKFSIPKWQGRSRPEKTQLGIHELMGLAGIADPGYKVSNKLMGYALPVQPALTVLDTANYDYDTVTDMFYDWNNTWKTYYHHNTGRNYPNIDVFDIEGCPDFTGAHCNILRFRIRANSQDYMDPRFEEIAIKVSQNSRDDQFLMLEVLPESNVAGHNIRENMLNCKSPKFIEEGGGDCYELKARATNDTFALQLVLNGVRDVGDEDYSLTMSYQNSPRGTPSTWHVQTKYADDDGSSIRAKMSGFSLRERY